MRNSSLMSLQKSIFCTSSADSPVPRIHLSESYLLITCSTCGGKPVVPRPAYSVRHLPRPTGLPAWTFATQISKPFLCPRPKGFPVFQLSATRQKDVFIYTFSKRRQLGADSPGCVVPMSLFLYIAFVAEVLPSYLLV